MAFKPDLKPKGISMQTHVKIGKWLIANPNEKVLVEAWEIVCGIGRIDASELLYAAGRTRKDDPVALRLAEQAQAAEYERYLCVAHLIIRMMKRGRNLKGK